MKNKKGPSQNWSRPNNEKNEHNEHAERTNEYKDNISHHGSINPAPSKITQFFRKFKANPFVQDIAKVAAITAPIGFIGKANAIKNVGSAFGNTAKQYLSKGTSIGKEYRVGGELYGHFTRGGKLTNKYVPVVGKSGKTVSVPKNSSTKQVSYANPRISMTKAEREAAGY